MAGPRAINLALVDRDESRRRALAAQLRELGHELEELEELSASSQPWPRVDVAILVGDELGPWCAGYRRSRQARWILALTDAAQIDDALAGGADDVLSLPASAAQIDERIRVARARAALGPGIGDGADVLDAVLPNISAVQLRTIVDNVPMPLGIVSADGVFVQCNRELEHMFGQAPGSIVGQRLSDVFANADVWEMLARVVTRGQLRDQQLELIGKDGVRRTVSGQAQWIPAGEGGYAIGAFVDISKRLRAEASIRSVLQAAPDGILVHRDGRFVYVNPAAVRWLGLVSAEAALGGSIYDYVAVDDAEAARERVAQLERGGESVAPRDFQFQRPDGELCIGELVSVAASFEGEPAIITIIRDVGEQRRMQSQMFLADRLATVGTLAVGVAHEINNPLAWVVGNLGLLADEFDNQVRMRELPGHDPVAVAASRARVRELLGRAQEGTERVRRIVRDLVRFGRSDEDESSVVDIHALLDSTIEIADVHLRHRARLARDYRSRGFVRGSDARLGQVFLNLLVNAGQSIEPGEPRQNQVRVETKDIDGSRVDDSWVEIRVSDTGCGMPEHVRKRVFEPFFTTKPVGEGTGIGLALSHEIVISFGGEIAVESEVGRGTCFCVRLRRASEDIPSRPAEPVRDDTELLRSKRKVRVLVVDDEPLIREMVCDALSEHELTAVSNGRDALAELLANDWDLVLCDMILPELSGLDVYRELEQQRPEILDKLVFMTGGEFSRKGPRLPSGAQIRRLEKPFSLKDLRALVREARRQL